MCNETGIPELLESRILGIPVVAIAILPSKILSMRAPYPYISVTRDSNSEEPSRVHYAK